MNFVKKKKEKMFCLNWKTASQKLDQNDKINAFVLIAWIFFFFRDKGLKNLDNEKLELKNRIKKKKKSQGDPRWRHKNIKTHLC